MRDLLKFPRTPHIEGSRLQPGDEDLEYVPFGTLAARQLVVTEKVDGANAGISFDAGGRMRLQSRGHFLTGGPRERQFDLFKTWAACHQARLFEALGSRHILYGEWLYAKHTVFYDALPHYFLAFDLFDTKTMCFLSTERRHSILDGLPLVTIPTLHTGPVRTLAQLQALIGPSTFKSATWRDHLRELADSSGLDAATVLRDTDPSNLMEGVYLKVEEDGQVVARAKFVRTSFQTAIDQSGGHWQDRPIVPNQLADGVDLFGEMP
jgi:hypothetical protein